MKDLKSFLMMFILLRAAESLHAATVPVIRASANIVVVNKSTTNPLRIDLLLESTKFENEKTYFVYPGEQAILPTSGKNINTMNMFWISSSYTKAAPLAADGTATKDISATASTLDINKIFNFISIFTSSTNSSPAAPLYVYAYADGAVTATQNTTYTPAGSTTPLSIPSRFLAVWSANVATTKDSNGAVTVTPDTAAAPQPVTMLSFNTDGTVKSWSSPI